MAQPVYCSAADGGTCGERVCGDGSTPYVWLSSIALLQWLPRFPPQAFPTAVFSLTSPRSVSQQSTAAPFPGIAPQSLKSSSQPLPFQRISVPVQGMYGCSKDCIPFRLPQISCFTLSFKCFSSDSVAPMWGSDPCFSFPKGKFHQVSPRVGPVLLTLPFFSLVPSFYRVLCRSIYLFSLVRYSCPLSADVLAALPCLKVCSWCVCGERCTPCPPPPLLSHPPGFYLLIDYQPLTFERLHVAIQVSVVSRKFGIALLTSLPTWQHLVVFRQILCSPVFHSVPQQASSGTSHAGPVGIELF